MDVEVTADAGLMDTDALMVGVIAGDTNAS